MELEEIEQKLSTLEKKLDKLLTLNTKIAKCLHLLPVTEKEERTMQIMQRKNLSQAAKVNDELNIMQNKEDEPIYGLSLESILPTNSDVYDDVLGEDYLGG